MSGGSFNYMCYKVKETYSGEMRDPELDEMLKDFCNVLHDLEWWVSCDYGEDTYRKTVKEFKDKWFGKTEEERIEKAINQASQQTEKYLRDIFAISKKEKQND